MGSSHPIRHRFGILLVCLVALLLARDPWYQFPQIHLAQRSEVPAQSPAQKALAPAQKFGFGFQSSSAAAHDLQPFFDYSQTLNLKCCLDDNAATPTGKTSHTPELDSTLNPNTFPQAQQFVRSGEGGNAIGSPEETSQSEEAFAGFVGGGSAGVWPGIGCANGLQNCDGAPQQNPDPGLKVPEPGSLILMLGGLWAFFAFRLGKR
jgi:hypothetical protein